LEAITFIATSKGAHALHREKPITQSFQQTICITTVDGGRVSPIQNVNNHIK
jgi:hypothetical protein